jgi:death-on-curing protein
MERFFWHSSDVIKIHDSIIDKYGGLHGLKGDIHSLESALDRPKQHLYYCQSTIPILAAVYVHGIVSGHVFNDGNKRTSIKIAEIFLIRNGYYLLIDNFRLEQLVLSLASNQIDLEFLSEQFSIFSEPFDISYPMNK